MNPDTTGSGIHAHLGDQVVVGGPTVGKPGRDGEVVGLHHDDGTPPYDIRWSDTGRVTLYFPGPDAHVRHLGDAEGKLADRQTQRRPHTSPK
ncbi:MULTISPECIES: DUF1918 domain-containing protein [unclassified Streptomyces]|uniref:DUF1918 domain-containing protein n=1 Tax=unclassified Streptomyces TaxID=2593676 RepID=UPI003866716E